ncbi:hypothetical protein HanIR_Chr09g0422881 [Helianthus annuus]|nr:hypothetical protein HanIR_Chr09g0422881 [Helianthus annuus]
MVLSYFSHSSTPNLCEGYQTTVECRNLRRVIVKMLFYMFWAFGFNLLRYKLLITNKFDDLSNLGNGFEASDDDQV